MMLSLTLLMLMISITKDLTLTKTKTKMMTRILEIMSRSFLKAMMITFIYLPNHDVATTCEDEFLK